MADEAEKCITARYDWSLEEYNQKRVENCVSVYAETATVMAPDQDPVVGRDAILQLVKEFGKSMPVLTRVSTEFFELMSDNVAYQNFVDNGKDKQGRTVASYHVCMLWKKINGEWYIEREIFNNRPLPASPADVAKKQIQGRIQGRIQALFDAFNNDDLDAALDIYAENPTLVPHDGNITKGKAAIKEMFRELIPKMKKLVVEELYYFELLNDVTAYTNSHMKSVDDNGKVKAVFRDCVLWTKVGDQWYIRRDMFNDRPLPKE